MKTSISNGFARPRRPARSIREIRQRQLGDAYQSPLDRLFYAMLNGLLYAIGGVLIDFTTVIVRSLLNAGNGEVFWLFTPFMLVLGTVIGFVVGKNAGAISMDALPASNDNHLTYIDDHSVSHDVFRGLGIGIIVFAILWLVMLLMI